jgi:hypothetical protein
VDPVPGEEIERLVDGLFRMDPVLTERLRAVLRD